MGSAARAGGGGLSGRRADRFPLLSLAAAVNGQEVDYAEFKQNRHLRGKTEEKKKKKKKKARIKGSDL